MQLKRLRGCIIYRPLYAIILFNYGVRVCPICIISLGVGWLALLIRDLGAMRRPDCKDKRGGINTHVFFNYLNITGFNNAEFGSYISNKYNIIL